MKRSLFTLATIFGLIPSVQAADQFQVDGIAAVLMAEGRSEGEIGMMAICEVIRNRGGNPFAQVMRHRQFSCLNHRSITSVIREMSKEKGWHQAQAIARKLMEHPEELGNKTNHANHFEKVGLHPFWTLGLKPVATISNLNFFQCR